MTARAVQAPAPLGWLPTGEPFYVPIGVMRYDGDQVQCHLCGRWLRLVGGSHLTRAHGWTIDEYRNAFQLFACTTTASPETSKLMRANMLRRVDGRSRADALREHQRALGIESALTGPRKLARWRSLTALRPDLLAEWHPTRNQGLDPRMTGPSSAQKVWWCCATCGHEWWAKPDARAKGYGCPRCGRRRTGEATRARNLSVAPGSSFAALRPDLLAEWHPVRNTGLDPLSLSAGSNVKVWWRCVDCGHEWQSTPHSRHRAHGPGCRSCSSRKSAVARWRHQRATA